MGASSQVTTWAWLSLLRRVSVEKALEKELRRQTIDIHPTGKVNRMKYCTLVSQVYGTLHRTS